MSLVLEMPTTGVDSTFIPPFDPANDVAAATAEAAADLLEQGEAEATDEDNDVCHCGMLMRDHHEGSSCTTPVSMGQPPAGEPADKPTKKKRTRKPKAEQPATAEQPQQLDPFHENPPAGQPEPPPAPPPAPRDTSLDNLQTSRSTRKFKIAQVEAEYVEVSLTINQNEELIEQAKAANKNLNERQRALAYELRHLRNDEAWQPELPLSDSPKPEAAAVTSTVADQPAVADAETISAHRDPDAWRSASIDELKLPAKLTETLRETGADTIGRLEDLRAEISQGRAKWPKGVGAAKITNIEDAVIKWLTENRDSQVIEEASQPAATAAVSSDSITPAAIANAAEQTDEEYAAEITGQAAAINTGEENCLARQHTDGDKFWQSGYEAFGHSDATVLDCPYVPGPERDDWLRGFMAAAAVSAPATTTAASAPAATLTDIDDI